MFVNQNQNLSPRITTISKTNTQSTNNNNLQNIIKGTERQEENGISGLGAETDYRKDGRLARSFEY